LGVALLPVVGVVGWIAYEQYQTSQPVAQSELWGLRIGMSRDDVLFRKGEPAKDSEELGDAWAYTEGDCWYIVRFKNDSARAIEIFPVVGKEYALPDLQGISSHSLPEDIEKKFGPPDAVSVSKDQTRRLFSYTTFGVHFQLVKGHVESVGVFDPKHGPMRFAEEAPEK
jgi:hypothetical protein